MASIYFKENKYDDAILLNVHNRVVETPKSNIFLNGCVKTPLLVKGVLMYHEKSSNDLLVLMIVIH